MPPLADENPVASKIEAARPSLETLAAEVDEPLEIVPAERATYVFIGKPPKRFSATIADREVVVTASASLGQKVDAIIRKVA